MPVTMSEPLNDLDEKLKKVKIPYHILDISDNKFTEVERRYLEKQLRSMFVFVGCFIPDKIKIDDVEFPLHDIIWKFMTKEKLSEQELSIAQDLIPMLDKKMKEDKKMISEYFLTDEEAEKLYFETCGLIKAIITLRELDKNRTQTIDNIVTDEKVKDAKRLLALIERIR